jgi:hypothetical protein
VDIVATGFGATALALSLPSKRAGGSSAALHDCTFTRNRVAPLGLSALPGIDTQRCSGEQSVFQAPAAVLTLEDDTLLLLDNVTFRANTHAYQCGDIITFIDGASDQNADHELPAVVSNAPSPPEVLRVSQSQVPSRGAAFAFELATRERAAPANWTGKFLNSNDSALAGIRQVSAVAYMLCTLKHTKFREIESGRPLFAISLVCLFRIMSLHCLFSFAEM